MSYEVKLWLAVLGFGQIFVWVCLFIAEWVRGRALLALTNRLATLESGLACGPEALAHDGNAGLEGRLTALETRPWDGVTPLDFATHEAEVEAKLVALGSMIAALKGKVGDLANTVESIDNLEFATKDDIGELGRRIGEASDLAAYTRNQLALVGQMLSPPEIESEI